MKKRIFYIALVMSAVILLFYLLFANTEEHANGFERKFRKTKIKLIYSLKLPDEFFGIVHINPKGLTLKNFKKPLTYFNVDTALQELTELRFDIPASFKLKTKYSAFSRNGQYSFLTNSFGDILRFEGNHLTSFVAKSVLFDQSKGLTKNAIVLRETRSYGKEKGRALSRINLEREVKVRETYRLPQQVEGMFSTDGLLYFDAIYNRILYLYYYRGEFLCLDTNLQLQYKTKTVDTIRQAQIVLGSIDDKLENGVKIKRKTQLKPPSLVNRSLATDEHFVYVFSKIKADNESQGEFARFNVIDVYGISGGEYLYSIRIPKYNGKKMIQFKILNGILYGLMGDYLVGYKL